MKSLITHVAVRFQDKIWSLPRPSRHHHVLEQIRRATGLTFIDVALEDEGFLNETGRFLNRRQALSSATRSGQILDPAKVRAGLLTSEDLW